MNRWTKTFLATALLGLACGLAGPAARSSAQAPQGAASLGAVAPLLEEQTLGVVRIDPARVSPTAIAEFIAPWAPATGPMAEEWKQSVANGERWKQAWSAAGGGEIVVAFSLTEAPKDPALVFGTVRDGGRAEAVSALLGELKLEERETIGAVVITGTKTAVARAKQNRQAAHADLLAALAVVSDSPVQIGVHLPADVRRTALELGPKLPPELGLGTSEELVGGFRWLAVGVDVPPKFGLKLVLQADGPAGAERWQKAVQTALQLLALEPRVRKAMPNVGVLAERLKPESRESRLELTLSGDEAAKLLRDSLAGPLVAARQEAARTRSMNGLKQIGLAMHNYHDAFRKFPAAANRGPGDRPLLSWRVHILPFLGEAPLYQKFKLDEPWDSAHNKALIASIPQIYQAPNQEKLAAEGKTVFVVPVGEKSVFADKDGMSIAKITDGTSNTILTVQVPASRAVVWTQPADWEFDLKNVLDGLVEEGSEGFLAGFCDGSVRWIAKKVDPKTLQRLLQANDGQVVDGF